ncbi:MAG TPA: hypothetical protein VIN10_06600 [Bacteroidales bacterium]
MKTNFKSIILGAALIITSSGIATATEATIKVNENETFELKLTDISDATQVSVKTNTGKILFEDKIVSKNDYSKKFNFELLEEGTYYVTVEDSRSIKTLPLELGKNQLVYNEMKMIEKYKPSVMQKGSMLYVNYFTPEKSSLDVSIYNSKGELVYSEILAGKMTQGKGYDFSKSPKGEYTIALASDGKQYSHSINLEQ